MAKTEHQYLIKAVPQFLDELAYGQNCSKETIRAYGTDLMQYLEFLEEYLETPAPELDSSIADHRIIRSFLSSLALRGISNNSLGRKLSTLRAFYDYLLRHDACSTNPAKLLRTPKVGERNPEHLTRAEASLLLDEPFEDNNLGVRNRAILELLYGSGIRVSELTGIDLNDIITDEKSLRVFGKGSKERDVVFGKSAVNAINSYLEIRHKLMKKEPQEQALFLNHRGGRLTSRSVARILKARIRDIGLRRGISPHALRHSFATHMLNNGADIRSLQELLGHASLSTTQRYTRVGMEELMKTYLDCHPRAKKK